MSRVGKCGSAVENQVPSDSWADISSSSGWMKTHDISDMSSSGNNMSEILLEKDLLWWQPNPHFLAPKTPNETGISMLLANCGLRYFWYTFPNAVKDLLHPFIHEIFAQVRACEANPKLAQTVLCKNQPTTNPDQVAWKSAGGQTNANRSRALTPKHACPQTGCLAAQKWSHIPITELVFILGSLQQLSWSSELLRINTQGRPRFGSLHHSGEPKS